MNKWFVRKQNPDIRIDSINIRLLANHKRGKEAKLARLNENVSDSRNSTKLGIKKKCPYRYEEELDLKDEKGNKLKYVRLYKEILRDIEKDKITDKIKFYLCTPFKIWDYYFENKIFNMCRYILEYGKNAKGDKNNVSNLGGEKFGFVCLVSTLLMLVPFIILKSSTYTWMPYILLGIGTLMYMYIFIKFLKNSFLVFYSHIRYKKSLLNKRKLQNKI